MRFKNNNWCKGFPSSTALHTTFKEVAEKHFKKAKGFTKRYYMQ